MLNHAPGFHILLYYFDFKTSATHIKFFQIFWSSYSEGVLKNNYPEDFQNILRKIYLVESVQSQVC